MLYVSLAYLYESCLLRFSKQSLGLQWKIGRRKGMVGVIFGAVCNKKLFHSLFRAEAIANTFAGILQEGFLFSQEWRLGW